MMRRGHVVAISFEGAAFASCERTVATSNRVITTTTGNDSAKWSSYVGLLRRCTHRKSHNGIDAVFYLDEGKPRYDLVVARS
jgi:hypothetical protein